MKLSLAKEAVTEEPETVPPELAGLSIETQELAVALIQRTKQSIYVRLMVKWKQGHDEAMKRIRGT